MTYKEIALQGALPEGLRILDAHAHLGDGEQCAAYIRTLPVEESLRLSRRIGIGAVVASSMKALTGAVEAGNERMMEFTRLYPGYVYASIFYHPNFHDACIRQLEKYRNDAGFVGVKIHPRDSHTCIATNDFDRLYAYCVEHDILVACHTWQTEPANDPKDFGPVMARFPQLKLQLCHMGGTYRGCMDSLELANKYPNVYLDINGSLYSQIWLEELVKCAPFEQFVFGTDQTFNDPRIMVGRVLMSDLTDGQKQQILCDNFERVIGRQLVKRETA